jgi:hypothetical protein
MDAGERALLATTVREAIAATAGTNGVDDALAAVGWLEMLDAEPRDAIDLVFAALGATDRMASVLDDVVLTALGTTPRADLAVMLPRYREWEPPGTTGLASPRAATAREMLVVSRAGNEMCTITVPMSRVDLDAVRGIDPKAGFHVARVQLDDTTSTPIDPETWDAAVAVGRRAVAHQIAGATRTMLDLARTHAVDRVQFGRPIARFQALQHRLAEALVAVEALDAALTAAADEPNPLTAALAKALAGRSARVVGTHCQQVLAGIGFTTEHPFHRYLKRTMLLDGVLGAADDIVLDVGRKLLATRTVPALIEL